MAELPEFVKINVASQNTLKYLDKRLQNDFYFKTDFTQLNNILGAGIEVGTNVILGGRPGSGKSLFGLLLALQAAKQRTKEGKPRFIIVYWNWEMTNEQQMLRTFSHFHGKSTQDIKAQYKDDSIKALLQTKAKEIEDYPIYFSSTSTNIESVQQALLKLKQANPTIPIINIFDHSRLIMGSDSSEAEEKKLFRLYSMCNVIKKMDCINIVLSQLNRKIEDYIAQTGKYRAPNEADLFGADAAGQFADTIAIMHNPSKYGNIGKDFYYDTEERTKIATKNKLWLEIVKNREGTLGRIVFNVNFATSSITNYSLA